MTLRNPLPGQARSSPRTYRYVILRAKLMELMPCLSHKQLVSLSVLSALLSTVFIRFASSHHRRESGEIHAGCRGCHTSLMFCVITAKDGLDD
jgi:hypothetical protein